MVAEADPAWSETLSSLERASRGPKRRTPGTLFQISSSYSACLPSQTKLQFSTLFGTSISEGTGDLALGLDGTLYVSGVRGPSNGQGPGATHPILTRFSADARSVIYSIELASNYDG